MIEVGVIPLLFVIGLVLFFMLLSAFLYCGGIPTLKKRCESELAEVIIDDESVGRGEKITVYLRFISPPKMVKELFPAHCRLALVNVFLALYPHFNSSVVGDRRDANRRVVMLREEGNATESKDENSEGGT